MKLLDALVRSAPAETESRYATPAMFGFNGSQYFSGSWAGIDPEVPDTSFLGHISGIHQRNGVVAAAVETRALLMSQLRFEWMLGDGSTTTNRATNVLNNPVGVSRAGFLKSLEYDASYSGSAFIVRTDDGLRRLRPDHVSFLLGSESDPDWDGDQVVLPHDAEVAALLYSPVSGGRGFNILRVA